MICHIKILIILIDFRERGRGECGRETERERERHQCERETSIG